MAGCPTVLGGRSFPDFRLSCPAFPASRARAAEDGHRGPTRRRGSDDVRLDRRVHDGRVVQAELRRLAAQLPQGDVQVRGEQECRGHQGSAREVGPMRRLLHDGPSSARVHVFPPDRTRVITQHVTQILQYVPLLFFQIILRWPCSNLDSY